jgi:hypothetical protein
LASPGRGITDSHEWRPNLNPLRIAESGAARPTTMSALLSLVALLTVAVVVVALFLVLWREHTSARDGWIAATSGILLAAWVIAVMVLARQGWFEATPQETVPPIGRTIGLALLLLSVPSPSRLRCVGCCPGNRASYACTCGASSACSACSI